jgi:hypothetical protein
MVLFRNFFILLKSFRAIYPFRPQSRQSAKLFLQSSVLGLPQPLTRRRVCPLPPVSGGRGIHPGERGVGRVPIPTRGHMWYSLYKRTLCFRPSLHIACELPPTETHGGLCHTGTANGTIVIEKSKGNQKGV